MDFRGMITKAIIRVTPGRRRFCITALAVLMMLLAFSGIVSANEYEGGIPLQTVNHGVVSGGLYFDSYPGFATSAYKSFSLPSHTTIEWARLYVSVYCGHKQNNYQGTATVNLDTNGDGTDDVLLGTEDLNVPYTYPGEGGTGPVLVGGHGNRVTSDYLFWYDIRDQLTRNKLGVSVRTAKVSPSFDGRIKFITLVVAYNDQDEDKVYYWVNQGHDPMCYLNDNGYTGETTFGTSQVVAAEDQEFTATLSSMYMASDDGTYTFNGDELAGNGAHQGPYFGSESWDVSDSVALDEESTLQYRRTGQYFKLPLALLTVSFKERPEGSLEITSVPEGAQIILDGEETNKKTNQTLFGTSAGEHTVQLILEDNENYREPDERTVNVRKGEITTAHFTIPQINGSIDVKSEPPGAWIYLDGKNTSIRSDALLEGVITGDHTIVLKKEGCGEANATLTVEEDQMETVELILPELTGISMAKNASSEGTVGYTGKSLSLYSHGSVRGSLAIMDAGGYSGLLGRDMSTSYPVAVNLSLNATVKEARLYVYTTWAYDADTLTGKPASLKVDMNGDALERDLVYSDRKGNGTYDYPVETHCYTVDKDLAGNQTLSFTITNSGEKPDKYAVYGVLLLVIYEDPAMHETEYWIGEGADIVYANPEFGVDSGNAITGISFPGTMNTTGISRGELYVVSTAASGSAGDDNRITFNNREWQDQLTGGSSGISLARLDVSAQVLPSGNRAGAGSVIGKTKGDYMENRNIILLISGTEGGEVPVNITSPKEDRNSPEEITVRSDTADGTDPALLATGPIEETLSQSGKYYSIRVLSNPPGAMISVDYEYCGKTTPDTIQNLEGGNHTISVELPGFETIEERLYLTNNQTLTFDMATRGTSTLSTEKVTDAQKALMDQEKYGGVYVTSSPEQTLIYIDGKKTGSSTPDIIYGLKEGKHTVQVKLVTKTTSDNREPIRFPIEKKEVWVSNGVITPISFRFFENPYLVTTVINSTLLNNSVFTLNGKMQKYRMPERVNLQTTQNFLTVREGDAFITYTIFSDNTNETRVEPRKYSLNSVWMESDPPGADIYVDGYATGLTTPYLVRNISDQEHLITISKPGYYPLESTVRIAGVDQFRRFVLEPYLYGRLSVMSSPSGGKIYLNGKDTGLKTPYTFQYMDVGKYSVKVVLNQTQAICNEYMVEPGITNEINLTLKKKR